MKFLHFQKAGKGSGMAVGQKVVKAVHDLGSANRTKQATGTAGSGYHFCKAPATRQSASAAIRCRQFGFKGINQVIIGK